MTRQRTVGYDEDHAKNQSGEDHMKVEPDRRLVVVGIQGAMGSGKSTIRKHLQKKHNAHWIPMSAALKRALVAMGADEADIHDPARKEMENPLFCGKTNRYALQTIGTEWGRELMGPDIWVNCAKKEVLNHLNQAKVLRRPKPVIVVFDDIRFPNEAKMVRDFGGTLWIVRRSEVEPVFGVVDIIQADHYVGVDIMTETSKHHPYDIVHPSERWWMIADCDTLIRNDDRSVDLLSDVDAIFAEVLEAHEEKWS